MPPGWINERVNTSDWEVRGNADAIGVGEIFGGSTWSEVAMLLTWAEWPGIYWRRDTGFLLVSDHLEVAIEGDGLKIVNPTKFDTHTKIWAETGARSAVPLDWPRIEVKAGETLLWKGER